jgi:hypothetical protein
MPKAEIHANPNPHIREVRGSSPLPPTILDNRQNSGLLLNQSVNPYRIGNRGFFPLKDDLLDETTNESPLFKQLAFSQ